MDSVLSQVQIVRHFLVGEAASLQGQVGQLRMRLHKLPKQLVELDTLKVLAHFQVLADLAQEIKADQFPLLVFELSLSLKLAPKPVYLLCTLPRKQQLLLVVRVEHLKQEKQLVVVHFVLLVLVNDQRKPELH